MAAYKFLRFSYTVIISMILVSILPNSKVLSQATKEINSIEEYQEIITSLWRNDPEKALRVSREAVLFAENTDDKRAKAIAIRMFGGTFYYLGEYDSALHYSKKAYTASLISGDSTLMASSLSNVGLNYVQIGMYPDGLEYLLRAYNIKISINQTYALGITLNNIGLVYTKLKDYHKAREYLEKAMAASDQYGDFDSKLYASNNLGFTYLYVNSIEEAEKYFNESLQIASNIESKSWESVANSGLGQVYLQQNKVEEARRYFLKSLKLYEELNDKAGISESYYLISKYFIKVNQMDSAFFYVNKSRVFASQTSSKQRKLDNYELLELLFSQVDRFDSAWYYKVQSVKLRDSIFNEGMARTLYNIELKVAKEEANKKLASKDIVIEQKTKQTYFLIALISFILIFSGILYRLYSRQTKLSLALRQKNQQIYNQKEEIEVQKEALYEGNQKLEKAQIHIEEQNKALAQYNSQLKSLIDKRTKELEVANIELKEANLELDDFIYKSSHDIKGPLVRLLGVCNVALLDIKDKTSKNYFEMFHSATTYLNNLFDKLKLINDINYTDYSFSSINLSQVIENVKEKLKTQPNYSKINIRMNIEDKLTLTSNQFLIETILYNLLENSIQFQKNDTSDHLVEINAICKKDRVSIHITDNGQGIPPQEIENIFNLFSKAALKYQNPGLGLYIVKLCVKKINGTIKLNHSTGDETQFELAI